MNVGRYLGQSSRVGWALTGDLCKACLVRGVFSVPCPLGSRGQVEAPPFLRNSELLPHLLSCLVFL